MKLPEPAENIYPRSRENFKAILDRYFPTTSDTLIEQSIEKLIEDKFLAINQVEFGARFVAENNELLNKANFSELPSARLKYAIMAIFYPRDQWSTSGANLERLEKFRELYRDSFFKEWPN